MRRSIGVLALGLGLGILLGCGSSASVDFFDLDASSSGGHGNNGGSAGAGPSVTGATCSPVVEAMGKMSGQFGTTGRYCLRVTDDIGGWGCSNFDGRTIAVNGVAVACGQVPLPDKIQGAYYFDVSAGTLAYASLYWYL